MSLLDKNEIALRLAPSGNHIKPSTILAWWRTRKIPGRKMGHRTILFDEAAVRTALEQFEVQAIGAR